MFAKLIEKALNQYLSLDPESPDRLKKLKNKCVTLELLGPNIIFQLVFNETIHIKFNDFLIPNTTIKGTPLSLLRMTLTEDRKQFFSDDVSIEGDLELGQQITDLFDQLEIDWEDYLSRFTGDVFAHQVGNIFRRIRQFNFRANETLTRNVNEYVHEEAAWFPTREALSDFFSDIDTLRMDIDRMSAKIAALKGKIK